MSEFACIELMWIGGCVLLLGMTKGGFPVGPIALPLLVLGWPEQAEAAKEVVAFMLPLLCVMDIVAVCFYRKHILFHQIRPLIPGTLIGVLLASALFVSGDTAMINVSDRWLRLMIGMIGICFVGYRIFCKWFLARLGAASTPGWRTSAAFGITAGITSTLAHAAGPVAQMYFLPRNMKKMNLAASMAGFFFGLNLIKLIPFALLGRFHVQNLSLALYMLPLIPVGVGAGYLLVRAMRGVAYIGLIYAVLLISSLLLVYRSLFSY